MPTAYPRLNLGQIRAKVRDLTNIEATLVVSDDRINNIINEELHKLVSLADELEQTWVGTTTPITITEGSTTYRIPGWRFDNTTQFPSGMPGNIFMSTDVSLAPWNTTANGTYKAGYFDNYLVYSAAVRVLAENNDDTNRGVEFKSRADEIASILVQQEYIAHNADQMTTIPSSSANFFIRLYFKTLYLLKTPLSIDADYSLPTLEVSNAIYDSRSELVGRYSWTGLTGAFSDWDPYGDVFSYAAAARLAPRYGLSEQEIASLLAEYQSREAALVREKLTNNSGNLSPATAGAMVYQVRSMLRDFSNELPTNIIYNWLNTEYQMLAAEHDWPWLTNTATLSYPAGVAQTSVAALGIDYGILNMYVVKLDGGGEVTDAQIVSPVPHILDGEVNDARYRYDISNGMLTITPTPTESIFLSIRYKTVANTITTSADTTLFNSKFIPYLVYRAAYLGSAWSDQAKKLSPMFAQEAQRVKDMMYQYYMTDRSTEPFSIGENALETRKYLPFFKAI